MVKNALKVLSKSGEGFTQTDGAGQISIKPGKEEALASWAVWRSRGAQERAGQVGRDVRGDGRGRLQWFHRGGR